MTRGLQAPALAAEELVAEHHEAAFLGGSQCPHEGQQGRFARSGGAGAAGRAGAVGGAGYQPARRGDRAARGRPSMRSACASAATGLRVRYCSTMRMAASQLQLASASLPIGAFSHSLGVEAAVDAGVVCDAASAERCADRSPALPHSAAAFSICPASAPVK